MKKTANDLVNVAEAGHLTGLDKATLYRLARQGRLRSFKVLGRALRFERADVLQRFSLRGSVVFSCQGSGFSYFQASPN